jgi:hypothetical protein
MRFQKITMTVAFIAAMTLGAAAFAATATTATATAPTGGPQGGPPPMDGGGPPPMGRNPAADAAMKACAGTVAKDAEGHPDHAAMKACMKAKGFNPPEHPPMRGTPGYQGNDGAPPPPQK